MYILAWRWRQSTWGNWSRQKHSWVPSSSIGWAVELWHFPFLGFPLYSCMLETQCRMCRITREHLIMVNNMSINLANSRSGISDRLGDGFGDRFVEMDRKCTIADSWCHKRSSKLLYGSEHSPDWNSSIYVRMLIMMRNRLWPLVLVHGGQSELVSRSRYWYLYRRSRVTMLSVKFYTENSR